MRDGGVVIPQVDPGAAYRAQKDVIDAVVTRVLASGWFVLGAELAAFEQEFARWLGAERAVGCGNGTDALALLMRGLGIGPGSSVVTVSHTAVATAAAIDMVGAVPVLVDVEPDYYTMDPVDLEAIFASTPPGLPPIRAVIAVHLDGQPADMDALGEICRRHGVVLLGDCCQAHGARYKGGTVGSFAEGAAFSFYPTKNLAALGDGGAVSVRRGDLADRIAALRQYGWRTRNISSEAGVNSRLDEIQAAILRVRLPLLDAANARRRVIASACDTVLAGSSIKAPSHRPGTEHAFHQYVVRADRRDALQSRLGAAGIATAVHYPVPIHRQPAYLGRVALGPSGCRVTDRLAGEVLSLPIYPEMSDAQVEHVCNALRGL